MTERFEVRDLPADQLAREREAAIEGERAVVPWADVREVGSTAVEGVIGKGDIDLLVRVVEARFEEARAALDEAFERNANQLSNAVYQGYHVPSPLDVAIQLTVRDGPYDDFVPFLEALAADPALIERYNALKRAWHGRPMDAYREAKSAFIREVLERRRRGPSLS